jgi:phage tail-like protein
MLTVIKNKILLPKDLLRNVYATGGSGQTFADTERYDPYKSFNFLVEITGNMVFAKAGFSKVSGLSASTDVTEYREGGDNLTTTKIPGLTKFDPITLERGMSEDKDMWNWAMKIFSIGSDGVQNAPKYKATMTIKLLDRDRTVVRTWVVPNAWVSGYKTGDMDASQSAVMIETLTVQHEGFKPVD